MSKIDGIFSKKNHLSISILKTIFGEKLFFLTSNFDKLALPVFSKYNGFL